MRHRYFTCQLSAQDTQKNDTDPLTLSIHPHIQSSVSEGVLCEIYSYVLIVKPCVRFYINILIVTIEVGNRLIRGVDTNQDKN